VTPRAPPAARVAVAADAVAAVARASFSRCRRLMRPRPTTVVLASGRQEVSREAGGAVWCFSARARGVGVTPLVWAVPAAATTPTAAKADQRQGRHRTTRAAGGWTAAPGR